MSLIHLGIAWLAGILLGSLLSLPVGFIWLLTSLPLAGLILWRNDRRVRLASACGLLFLFGILRYRASAPPSRFDEKYIAYYHRRGSNWVNIRGIVSGETDVRITYTNLRVAVEEIALEGEKRQVRGTVLVRSPPYPEYHYGDRLEIQGLLTTPPEFEDFSYREYLARQGIHSLLRRPQITLLARGQGNPFYTALFALKRRAQLVIARVLPEPQAALLTGILLGVEKGIPASLMDDFNATGTTHIIAISGFNISIIAGLLAGLASRLLGRRRAMPFALAGIALYTILVGAYAAVVRAAIMGGLYLIAVYYGRPKEALTSLVASAVIMTIINPLILWDVGFQLSFAATLGLILYTPPLQVWFERWLSKLLPSEEAKKVVRLLNDALIVTIAAQITTLPIVVYHFRRLSLVTLLTNFLILPAQPGVMVWGGVATISGLIWMPLGQIAAWVAWLFLTYTIRMVELTAGFPLASLDVGGFGPGFLGLYYGLLALGTFGSREELSRLKALWRRLTEHLPTKVAIAGLFLAAILVWAAVASLPDGKLHVTFLEGGAIFIQTPMGNQILIDGSSDPTSLAAALGRRLPFWDRTIELVVLTKPCESRLVGLIPVLERYRVGTFLESEQISSTPPYGHCRKLIEERGIARREVQRGTRISLEEGLEMAVLHPGPEADANGSVVLRLSYGEASFFLADDIGEEAQEAILESGMELSSTVLERPSHGRLSREFLSAVRPGLAVVSGRLAPEILARLEEGGAAILSTDKRGAIEVVTDGKRLWLISEH